METREHRGVALAALGAVGLVTAAWWVLALYPAASAPEWMLRTRSVCFGAPPGGLPDAGGWILLAGQPVGMLVMLFAGWGSAVRRDLLWFAAHMPGKFALGLAAVLVLWGAGSAVRVVRNAHGAGDRFSLGDPAARPRTVDIPPLRLTDQHAGDFDLGSMNAGPVIVTFAFAHCATMCPTAIRELLKIRAAAGRADIPLVVITVDPWRDVPSRLSSVAAAWKLEPGDRVLSGSIEAVNSVLDAWSVARVRDETTGDVVHPLAAVLVHAGGKTGTRIDGGLDGLRAILTGT